MLRRLPFCEEKGCIRRERELRDHDENLRRENVVSTLLGCRALADRLDEMSGFSFLNINKTL